MFLFLITKPIATTATTRMLVAPINAKVLGANVEEFVAIEVEASFVIFSLKSVKIPVVTTYV